MMVSEWKFLKVVQEIEFHYQVEGVYLASLNIQPTILQQVRYAQLTDYTLSAIRRDTGQGLKPRFRVSDDGLLRFNGRVCLQ